MKNKTIYTLLFLGILLGCAQADQINVNTLAHAIYKAEGVHSKYPYGILRVYKTTTPRQACINTINHALRDWNGKGDFIHFLQQRYCPISAKNDPQGLNKNWYKNVTKFYKKELDINK